MGQGGSTYNHYILKPSNYVTFDGIKVTLVASKAFGEIEITKVVS
jgi:hypothetical protein